MKTLQIDSKKFTELSLEECSNIDGGSELSEQVFRTLGGICRFFYEAAISEPIRPSTYR